MGGREAVDDPEHKSDESLGAVAAPGAIGRAAEHRVPGKEVLALRG
jgi:hypothetical protein